MPVVLANLKPATLEEIQRLVDAGHYASPAEFLELAAANQLQLEGESGRPKDPASLRPKAPPRAIPARAKPEFRRSDSRANRGVLEDDLRAAMERLLLAADVAPPAELPLKPPDTATEGRIWGQINRLLPLKVALRWLAVRGVSERRWSTVDEILGSMGADAAVLGSALEQVDSDADRRRDELLATGLPRVGSNASIDRFLSQYIARVTRTAIHGGALMQYGLASVDDGRLSLTTTGFQLAVLRNPVIDGDPARARRALSEGESEFFVDHAVPHVPSELHDFSLILSFVDAGQNTPSEQLELMGARLPEDWTDAQVRTHVTGAVARMVDLGLLTRNWEGRRVQYEMTAFASDFLNTRPDLKETSHA